MARTVLRLGALAPLALLAACATKSLPAITDISAHQCAASPDLGSAVGIAFDGAKEAQVKTDISDASPCLKYAAGSGLYAAYALPKADAPYVLSVMSIAQGDTLLVPRVMMLASDGSVKREFSGPQIDYRGNGVGTMFRSHADETYMVVASDAAAAGKTNQRIEEATQVYTGATAYGTYQVHTGSDTMRTFNLSHNGHLEVTLTPIAPPK
jgi:Maltose operon periplasmic protein precursor (MalM)